jgi:predicted ATPase
MSDINKSRKLVDVSQYYKLSIPKVVSFLQSKGSTIHDYSTYILSENEYLAIIKEFTYMKVPLTPPDKLSNKESSQSSRLFKVAKDLNVGSSVIVEYLMRKGFNITNDPNAKITAQQLELLYDEFKTKINTETSRPIGLTVIEKIDLPKSNSKKKTSSGSEVFKEKFKDKQKSTKEIKTSESRNSIGFKNFRGFANFEPIPFSDITFLVGKNNSGKSTLVKAFLLIVDYLKSEKLDSFSFNNHNIEDVNVVTFNRALNNKAKLVKEDKIEYSLALDGYRIQILITGDAESTEAKVISLMIDDYLTGFSYYIKPQANEITFSTNERGVEIMPEYEENILIELEDNRNKLIDILNEFNKKESHEYIQTKNKLVQIEKKIADLKKTIRSKINVEEFSLEYNYTSATLRDIFDEAITEHFIEYKRQFKEVQNGKKQQRIFESLKAFKESQFKIEKSVASFLHFRDQIDNEYLGAALNKQSALFAIRDKQNPLAQAIHEYKQLGIDKDSGSDASKFVKNWMQKSGFEIGESFEIIMHAGEAYEVLINTEGEKIPLADKGMGSIQTMLLLLRIAVIIYKQQMENKKCTLIIEEPELNLHPALQSKLADLFHEIYVKFKIRLIIETHSEYLIRKTQLIVKQNEYEVKPNVNPFSVIYFDKDQQPWQMNYREDGKFIESFGKGFYDVSSSLTLNLL